MGKKWVGSSVIIFLFSCPSEVALPQSTSTTPIVIPAELGYVTETHLPTATDHPAVIVHIQEAHTNQEAQQHIANILERLIADHGLKLVLVEGGEGDVGLASLRQFGPPEHRNRLADKYFQAGVISAEEYLDIVSDHPLILWGQGAAAFRHAGRIFAAGVEDFEVARRLGFEPFRTIEEAIAEAERCLGAGCSITYHPMPPTYYPRVV